MNESKFSNCVTEAVQSFINPQKSQINGGRAMIQLPEPTRAGRVRETGLSYFYNQYKLFRSQKHLDDGCAAERYACGFPVPPFQRTPAWTREQQIKFVESCWLGLPIGLIIHHAFDWDDHGPRPQSGWLLDGQNRLLALEAYWNNEFEVFGGFWKDLESFQKLRFGRISLPHSEPEFWGDEQACRELYNRMAFGGIAHKESERA